MPPKILVLNSTCQDVIEDHRAWATSQGVTIVTDPAFRMLSSDRLPEVLKNAQGVIGQAVVPILPEHMAAATSLQVISLAASGFEYVDIPEANKYGIVVTNAPITAGAEVVADMTFALILSVAREIPYHHQLIKEGRYERGIGVGIYGKKLGVIGLGNIGKSVAQRAVGFSMEVLVTEINPDMDFIQKYNIKLVPLEQLLRESDFVSLHLRIDEHTRGIIAEKELELMKSTAYLINTARPGLVEKHALTKALLEKKIAGAALDDPYPDMNHSLFNLPNFICTPHLGNRAREGMFAVTRCALQNAIDVVQGRRPRYVVNPEVYHNNLRAPQPRKI